MRCNYIRERRVLCGEDYMTVSIYAITPIEHASRGRKRKESSPRQKAKNKMASMRRRQRKVMANFTRRGFFVTLTYEPEYLPEDIRACKRDADNYKRRVIAAVSKRFGDQAGRQMLLMLMACRKGENGRLHIHGFAECAGLGDSARRELRELLEDLWRRRIPGTNEYEPMGTANVDRLDMKKLLGVSGEGGNGTLGYFYAHKERLWSETKNLRQPIECAPNDSRWSRKQLRTGCADGGEDLYWWGQRFEGWEVCKCTVFDPGGLHESADSRADGWENTEPQAYLILRKRGGFAKVRT